MTSRKPVVDRASALAGGSPADDTPAQLDATSVPVPRDLPDDAKLRRLTGVLRGMGRVIVAYSGGVDSAFLLKLAHDTLGSDALGVLAVSESLDRNESEAAQELARRLEIPIRVIRTNEYDNDAYRRNDGARCYHCKTELFVELGKLARELDIAHVLDGSNADDALDYRPGMRARSEQAVRSPLQEAGLTKAEIRDYSRALGLPTWDKPAAPCLSSRIPYGSEVTREKLRQIEAAEAAMRELGFRVVRVRHHDTVARIEVPAEDFPRLLDGALRERVVERVKAAGFAFVALDVQGFRSGSLNEALAAQERIVGPPPSAPIPPAEVRLL